MSAYTTINTKIKDRETLKTALHQLKLPFEEGINLHLYGYKGDKRKQTADIVVRRKYVGSASNDIGFKRLQDGSYEMIISEFDKGWMFSKGRKIQQKIKDAESEEERKTIKDAEEARKQMEEMERKMKVQYAREKVLQQLDEQGFKVSQEVQQEDGTLELVAARWA